MNRLFALLLIFISYQSYCQKKDLGLQFILNENEIEGGMLFFDLEENDYYTNNKKSIRGRNLPGTSFQLFNALMLYHLGIVKDSTQSLEWDGEERYFDDRKVPVWNQDTYLAEAFRNGTDWFFNVLSKDIELKLFRKYVMKSKYGNMMSTRQENQDFWHGGAGKVSIEMKEQIKFLRRLQKYKLPFKKEHIHSVQELMLEKSTEAYKLYGKVGLSKEDNLLIKGGDNIGWYIGYVECKDNTYFFVSYISKSYKDDREEFFELRKKVVRKGLKHLFDIDVED
ncbi:MAG: beta-lactamase class D [Saprospiraceae bacterium]|jgi:beta-lactamase class D